MKVLIGFICLCYLWVGFCFAMHFISQAKQESDSIVLVWFYGITWEFFWPVWLLLLFMAWQMELVKESVQIIFGGEKTITPADDAEE
jgi:hypothetical protein